jgi:hypothetical protein
VLRVGALAVLLAGSIAGAFAQSSSPSLLRPELYGDPRGPAARFQKAAKSKDTSSDLLSASTFQVTSGAGTTGFDSTGKRKAKGKAKAKPAALAPEKSRGKDKAKDQGSEKDKAKAQAQAQASPPPPLPSPVSRYGSPDRNPYTPLRLAVPRPATGVARKGAT